MRYMNDPIFPSAEQLKELDDAALAKLKELHALNQPPALGKVLAESHDEIARLAQLAQKQGVAIDINPGNGSIRITPCGLPGHVSSDAKRALVAALKELATEPQVVPGGAIMAP